MHPLISATDRTLVGRARDLARLREALGTAAGGHGRLIFISGEPGIGKTRLADELARLAHHDGAEALWANCPEGGSAPAFWPWVQLIRAYARQNPAVLG